MPWEPTLIKYTEFCVGCALQVFCAVTHISEWVVPSTEIKYTRATVTQSPFEKSVLVSHQGFSISWSVCKWVTKDFCCFSCVYSNICTNQGRMLRGSRWLLWSYWGSSPSALASLLKFARISGDPGGDSLSCCKCLQNVTLNRPRYSHQKVV